MKRFLTMALAGVLALGMGSAAYAVECALDNVPASTLLFPFVNYDYVAGEAGNSGQTTLIAITNVSSDAQIVHITLWTDYSIAILDFNLTLTGYDVQTINIRDILRDGVLPSDDTGANEWCDGSGRLATPAITAATHLTMVRSRPSTSCGAGPSIRGLPLSACPIPESTGPTDALTATRPPGFRRRSTTVRRLATSPPVPSASSRATWRPARPPRPPTGTAAGPAT